MSMGLEHWLNVLAEDMVKATTYDQRADAMAQFFYNMASDIADPPGGINDPLLPHFLALHEAFTKTEG